MQRLQRLYHNDFVPELEPDPAYAPKPLEPFKPGELCDNEFCFDAKRGPHAHVPEGK